MNSNQTKLLLRRHDFVLFAIMGILAGCGLIYEYLLSHYAGRVLGAVEQVIFAMIGKGLGVVNDSVFSVIIIMVILTTLMTPPILTHIIKNSKT